LLPPPRPYSSLPSWWTPPSHEKRYVCTETAKVVPVVGDAPAAPCASAALCHGEGQGDAFGIEEEVAEEATALAAPFTAQCPDDIACILEEADRTCRCPRSENHLPLLTSPFSTPITRTKPCCMCCASSAPRARAHPRVCRWSPLPPGRPRTLPTSRVQESLVPCRCAPSPLASVF
jgi:hypothetical protein